MKCKSCQGHLDKIKKLEESRDNVKSLHYIIDSLERHIKAIESVCRENLADKCTCLEDYKRRDMTDPFCDYCNWDKPVFKVLDNKPN